MCVCVCVCVRVCVFWNSTLFITCTDKDRIPEKKRLYFLQQMEGIERLAQHSKAIALPAKEMLYELLCKLSCNTFSILDESLNSLGEGLYIMCVSSCMCSAHTHRPVYTVIVISLGAYL